MKLFIPTTSLNADNILSCECILPAKECRKRQFVYSHFEVLPELKNHADVTLAFSKIPIYGMEDLERECYPMVISIEITDGMNFGLIEVGEVAGIKIFATSQAIRIAPANSQLIFFTPKAMQYTLQSCSDSAKCKLFNFFVSRFTVTTEQCPGMSLQDCISAISIPSYRSDYTEDKFDKVKGFLWGYGMGAALSIPSHLARLLKIQKRVYDIISSTKNDSCLPQSLIAELEQLDKEYTTFDLSHAEIKSKWEVFAKQILSECFPFQNVSISDINKFLNRFGVENAAKTKFLSDNNLSIRRKFADYTQFGKIGYERFNSDLKHHIEALLSQERMCKTSFSVELDVDHQNYDSAMMSGNSDFDRLFNSILVRVIWDNIIPSLEQLRINKSAVGTNVVKTLKSIIEDLGEQWVGTPIQLYFNAMRKNITEFTPFDVKDNDNVVLQSVAAFILKGEDFNELRKYLEVNAISNYRYAFALWGAVSGYVSIPRSIIESNFSKAMISHIFAESQTSLKLDASITLPELRPQIPQQREVTSFRDRVLAFFDSIPPKKKDNLRKGLVETLDKLESAGALEDGYLLVRALDNKPGWDKKPKAWERLKEEFCPDYEQQINGVCSIQSENTLNLFSESLDKTYGNSIQVESHNVLMPDAEMPVDPSDISIINDDNALSIVENILVGHLPQVLTLFIDFQQKYRSGYYHQHPERYRRNNSDVIDHFCKWCFSSKNERPIDNTQENREKLNLLKTGLSKLYRD